MLHTRMVPRRKNTSRLGKRLHWLSTVNAYRVGTFDASIVTCSTSKFDSVLSVSGSSLMVSGAQFPCPGNGVSTSNTIANDQRSN